VKTKKPPQTPKFHHSAQESKENLPAIVQKRESQKAGSAYIWGSGKDGRCGNSG